MIRNFTLIIFMLFLCACHGSNDVNKNNIIENSNSYGEYQNKEPSRFLIALQFMYLAEFKESSSLIKNYDYKKQDYRKIFHSFIILNKKCFDEGIDYKEASKLYYDSLDRSNIPHDAWFFADIYDVFDENERNKFWRKMNSNSERESEEKIFVDLWFKMKTEAESTSIEKRKKSQRWLKRMRKIPLVIEIEKTMTMVEDSFRYKK